MAVLVTGGAGFIGSHICERFLREGYDVICLDNFNPYYEPRLKRNNVKTLLRFKKFNLIEGDIRDQGLIRKILSRDVDYVFHYAAQAGVRISVQNPMETHEINATGTLSLLQVCLDSGIKHIINASSSSVYGNVKYLPFDESHPLTPISPYGVSKLVAEHYCQVFSEIYGIKIISFRLFTVYGPGIRPDLAISIFTQRALRNETVEIFGDGTKTRDFTHIDDVVEANLIAMEKADSGIYNIGSGSRISIDELAEKIIKITGASSRIVHTKPQRGDADHTWAEISKAKKELEWKPQVDLEQGLERFVDWKRKTKPKRKTVKET